jgi:hypothetical protein
MTALDPTSRDSIKRDHSLSLTKIEDPRNEAENPSITCDRPEECSASEKVAQINSEIGAVAELLLAEPNSSPLTEGQLRFGNKVTPAARHCRVALYRLDEQRPGPRPTVTPRSTINSTINPTINPITI